MTPRRHSSDRTRGTDIASTAPWSSTSCDEHERLEHRIFALLVAASRRQPARRRARESPLPAYQVLNILLVLADPVQQLGVGQELPGDRDGPRPGVRFRVVD